MRYRIYQTIVTIALLLRIASATLWVRSFWISDWMALIHRHAPMRTSSAGAATLKGSFGLYLYYATNSDYSDPRDTIFQYNPQPVDAPMVFPFDLSPPRWLGFRASVLDGNMELIAPGCFVALIAGAIAGSSGWRLCWLRNGRRSGLCPRCGYDLRATPDRCPECGTVPAD